MQYTNPQYTNNPYNPYLCNNQHYPNVATAPLLDEVSYIDQLPRNHNYVQQPRPMHLYPDIPYNVHYMTPVEQYNREMQIRKKQQEDDCCCFGLLTILCCCFIN